MPAPCGDQDPMRIGVISHSQNQFSKPERYVSKNAAAALVRRLLAVYVSSRLIQMVDVTAMGKALPNRPQTQRRGILRYEHHVEPRLVRFNLGNSPWLQFVNGYSEWNA